MMEIEQLEKAISRVKANKTIYGQQNLDRWGGRTYTWTQAAMQRLDKQLHWLDSNLDHEKYEERFTEWEASLREYERACNLLTEAKAI